jgi:hypothetical protein
MRYGTCGPSTHLLLIFNLQTKPPFLPFAGANASMSTFGHLNSLGMHTALPSPPFPSIKWHNPLFLFQETDALKTITTAGH